MTLHEIKAKKEAAVTSLLNDCRVFWAFSNEQFEKNKTPLQEGEKYVSIGAGGYLPKSKVDDFTNGMEDINKTYKKLVTVTKKMRYDNIAYELSNYEAYYTGDIDDALDALGSGYTAKEVWKVFHQENSKQIM